MRTVFLVLPICLSLGMSSVASETTEHPEWKSYFEASGAAGTIVVTDLAKEETHVYNPQKAAEPFIPASTYKIPIR
jgi:beta-lactamase class D